MDVQEVWVLLQQHQGEQFYTAKCLPFCYIIRGGELFVDGRIDSIAYEDAPNRQGGFFSRLFG